MTRFVTKFDGRGYQDRCIDLNLLPLCFRREITDLVLFYIYIYIYIYMGGGPRVVVSTAAFHARVRGSVPGLGGLKETKLFLPHPRVKVSIVGSLRDREVACSASDRQGSNFESCVWRTVSSQSSHHPQEVLLAQFSLYVHKGGLKPDSFHFFLFYFINKDTKNFIQTFDVNSSRRSCDCGLLCHFFTRTETFKKSYFNRNVSEWNSLPLLICESSSLMHHYVTKLQQSFDVNNVCT